MKVQLFIPCFIDQLYPEIGFNTIKILEKLGCSVIYNPNQTCCGQPAYNAGFQQPATAVCNKFLKDFDTNNYIVAPGASCIGFLKNYAQNLFAGDNLLSIQALSHKAFELTEFIVEVLKKTDLEASFQGVGTYHDSCAALRECHIKAAPRLLLEKVKGFILKEMKDTNTCCGFGGSFSIKFPVISTAMADQKLFNALATQAEYIISTDMSCLMHLEAVIQHHHLPLKVKHITEVLASGW